MKFYTHCVSFGNKLLFRGYENLSRITERRDFNPTLYVNSKKEEGWSSLYGQNVAPVDFGSLRDAREFIKTYKEVEGFDVHGMTDFHYQYISDNYEGTIEYDVDKIKTTIVDIEVYSKDGFPDIASASAPVVLIAVQDKASKETIVFGWRDYNESPEDEFEYRQFKDEYTMLKAFIQYWKDDYPDIVSGWNSDLFDMPYLVNRIARVLDDDAVSELSPFGIVRENEIMIHGKPVQSYQILGVNQIDYLDAYKKFGTYSAKESYALGFIAREELGETKLEIEGAESFNDGYERFYDEFVRYNAKDVHLVYRLDEKKKLFDLIISIAYLVKCNFKDVFGPVKTWDVFIYNHLKQKNIAIPPRKSKIAGEFAGAWVKEPVTDMYGWGMSFDFASLYPTIIRQWNLSPETLVKDLHASVNVSDFINNEDSMLPVAMEQAKENNYSLAANGTFYKKEKKGMLPELMEYLMVGRKQAKREMLDLESEYEKTKNKSLKPKIDALNMRQLGLKVLANAGYGAITNIGFRYFELKIGEAITLTGQVSDMHAEKSLNVYMNKLLKTTEVDYVTYGDTDSVYLNVQPLVNKICKDPNDINKVKKTLDKVGTTIQDKVIQGSVDAVYDMCNCYDKLMDMKREAIYSKAFWTAKKRYAMLVHNSEGVDYEPYKLKIMGLDMIKSSTPQVVRKMLKDSLPLIFEQGEDALQQYVKEMKEKFFTLEPEDIAFPRSASDIDKWVEGKSYKKGTPIHIRGCILFNQHSSDYRDKYDKLRNGDKVKFVYLNIPNPIKQNVISFNSSGSLPKELGLRDFIDYDTMFEKTFMSPLEGIAKAIKYELEKKATLEDFFG